MTSPEMTNPDAGPLMPLAMALVGQKVSFVRAEGGLGLTRRLAEIGLTPGQSMQVINRGPGPFIVLVRGSKLLLGQGMVRRILVRPWSDEEPASRPRRPKSE